VIERARRANATRLPEDSRALRVLVLLTVEAGTLALVAEQAISGATGIVVAALLAIAYWFSYRRRAADNWHVKVVLAVAAILALARFFLQLGDIASLDQARFPLAEVFLWVQVLHGFDLPARRDLYFSLGASVALVAVAGSLSQDLTFGVVLVGYLACAFAALAAAHYSEAREGAAAVERVAGRLGAVRGRALVAIALKTAVAAVLLFLVIPQPTGARAFALPFSLGPQTGSPAGGALVNPGFSGEASSRSSSAAYYGLSQRMDLRVRGNLSDELVMRVRSSAPAMWKGALFDAYDGVAWQGDQSDPVPLQGGPPYAYPTAFRSLGPRATVIQTYYVEKELPSAVFAAGQPDEVWFDGGVSIDELGGLRTASTLTEGTVYSVVSSRGAAGPRYLRSLPHERVPAPLERYLQLPRTVPQRVHDLARRITAGAESDYERVVALEEFLRSHYRYSLDSPVPPAGRDAVDHFLFDAKVGFCEQFASALAVMLRTLDIPARLVTGYAVGRRNVFTGYYDVRASDAHAWVEVWFPRAGWYEFDPTFAVPPARTDLGSTLPLAKLVEFVADRIGRVSWNLAVPLRAVFATAVVAAVVWAAMAVRKRLRRRASTETEHGAVGRLGPVAAAFAVLEAALADQGTGRRSPETARELLARSVDLGRTGTRAALESFERERYGSGALSPEEARGAVDELERLAAEARSRPEPMHAVRS